MNEIQYVYVYEGTYTPIPEDVYAKRMLKEDLVYDIFDQVTLTKETNK